MSSTLRLTDVDGLEAALERGVLLDVLAVLVERGRADQAELAPGEHRLDHVAGVDRALGAAGADDRVELVDEADDLALGVGDLLEDGLEPLLELAAVLRARDHRADVERDERACCADPRARRPRRCAARGPSTMAVLPTPGSPMSTGLFLVRRDSTWMTRRISSSRPMTGSSLPLRASSVRSRPNRSRAWYWSSGFSLVTRWLPRTSLSAASTASCVTPRPRRRSPTPPVTSVIARRTCSVER